MQSNLFWHFGKSICQNQKENENLERKYRNQRANNTSKYKLNKKITEERGMHRKKENKDKVNIKYIDMCDLSHVYHDMTWM